mmetsp:Transcript_95544/g.169654  ORF Transcript_95544/g.169654 Transcript_95544/m.169654 type:complete len:386 (-) Transcript_95544:131-1288(-)
MSRVGLGRGYVGAHDQAARPSGGPASSAAVAAAVSAAEGGSLLDIEFADAMQRVEAALRGAPRHIRIRGEQWAQRLGLLATVKQPLFRKDRNLHAELLLKCIQESRWTEPMDKHPPEGPLPSLPRHVACALRREKQERDNLARGAKEAIAEIEIEQRQTGHAQDATPKEKNVQASKVRRSASLAGVASAAVGSRSELGPSEDVKSPGCGPHVTVAAPSAAYSALAARVTQLEEQNKKLRRQLGQAQRRSVSPSARGNSFLRNSFQSPMEVESSAAMPAGPFRASHKVASRGREASRGRSSSPIRARPLLSTPPRQDSRPWPQEVAQEVEIGFPGSEPVSKLAPPGPAPPEGDTEGFLRYLDAFQDYAGSLFSGAPPATRESWQAP